MDHIHIHIHIQITIDCCIEPDGPECVYQRTRNGDDNAITIQIIRDKLIITFFILCFELICEQINFVNILYYGG
jgi:hypothetical protein